MGVTMSLHKLTAGSGYDYLTRQVAAQDVTERGGHQSLASYYAEKGESPGVWVGSGLTGLAEGLGDLEALELGDVVTQEQMRHLFGSGRHPLADQIRVAAIEQGVDPVVADRGTWLGRLYPVYVNDIPEFRRRVAERMIAINAEHGEDPTAPGDPQVRAQVRTAVAIELFTEEHGRAPVDAREIVGSIARHSRPQSTAVAGFDLTFSPVKSVSTLWAIAPTPVAAAIERAHRRAVQDALTYLEKHALYTREGAKGVRQVETRGLIAAAFTHRDSRAGDPDLHTHVAVANKVQARESGKWLAIDGRVLYKANVAASETYNTALEHHLRAALGVRFEVRPDTATRVRGGKRVVREIVGIDPGLNERWSSRRADITARTDALSRAFQADHGRPPTPVEAIHLAQQATLETRAKKHEPRSLDGQRATWAAQAAEVLGGPAAVQSMMDAAMRHGWDTGVRVDTDWITTTAARIRDILHSKRSHWQVWHVRAEALRQVRGTDLDSPAIDTVVDLLTDRVLSTHSLPLARPFAPEENARERLLPDVLRRSDGSSVYTLAGAAQYTSREIVAAEARIVAHAARRDGHQVPANVVDLAMVSCAANGLPLNAGQSALVRDMASSGARVQLAIAPAGAGKTTAMTALTRAWVDGGGTVIGLAPSAAAADVLSASIDSPSDTLAKLAWHLQHPALADLPDWAKNIDERMLVVIDEAGMAETLTLDTVIEHVINSGGSVRLIGDDQQLAAVGAGGILRDIQASHGALHLSELMRFTNPAEGAASLALREGLPEAIGFYLDHDRVHVGDQATLSDHILTAWAADRAAGRDSIMLAPTRDLVAELNMRARAHRLTTTSTADPSPSAAHEASRSVVLADGNQASVGDVVITRSNDRRLRTSGTDWVKNGDRWHINNVHPNGTLRVRHARTGRTITLPTEYVSASVELGYACTIHTAQGVTAELSHTLLTGAESRQVAYTAITRGRTTNHLYVQVVGDGDPHSVIRPEHTHPATPAGLLEQILARDDSARSATTLAREAAEPTVRLGETVAQYVDSVHVAAQQHLEPGVLARLDAHADQILPGLTVAPAWESLRAHLILHAVETGTDPLHALHAAATAREVDTAGDVAAVIDWRLDSTGHRSAGTGPLPWLPGIPDPIANDPDWGPYLASLAATVRALRDQVTHATTNNATTSTTGQQLPGWARQGHAPPAPDLLADVAIFRAATVVDPADRRPTGPAQFGKAARTWQNHLNHRLAHHHAPAMAEWSDTFTQIFTDHRTDPFTPVLAERLAAISRAGLDTPTLLRSALEDGPLPDEQQPAALWWRISARLSPAVATSIDTSRQLETTWSDRLPHLISADHADTLRGSPWWPALVTVIDHALARGNTLESLLTALPDDDTDVDPCQGLLWRINTLNNPPAQDTNATPAIASEGETTGTGDEANPFWEDTPDPATWTPTETEWAAIPVADEPHDNAPSPHRVEFTSSMSDEDVEATISWAALVREYAGPLEPSDHEIETALRRAYEADTAPVSPERIVELNHLALDYFTSTFPGSWAQTYLTERLRTDITDHPSIRPGYAPAGWTNLIDHLRHGGASDLELTESGLVSITRHGRLIDRFRDRLILPITTTDPTGQARVLGFIARANPHLDPRTTGPKYLNTPDTVLFRKGAQLFTTGPSQSAVPDVVPVLVEGPMDAIAVTIATNGDHVGLAPLGTSLTEDQARELAHCAADSQQHPVVAFDADDAGQRAAERAYWLLTQHNANPQTVTLRPGTDPAEILTLHGVEALQDVLAQDTPLSQTVLHRILSEHGDDHQIVRSAADIITAAHPDTWEHSLALISQHTDLPAATARRVLADQLQQRWRNPHAHAQRAAARTPTRNVPRNNGRRSSPH